VKNQDFNANRRALKEEKLKNTKTRLSKKGIYLLTIITLFLISFSTTAFIIINANKLTFSGGNSGASKDEITALQEQLAQKDKTIEELTLQLSSKNSSSFSPPPKETAKPKSTSTPKPTASSNEAVSSKSTAEPSDAPVAVHTPTPTIKPTQKPASIATPKPSATPVQ
jgi:cytoskeletal protein RodZ